MPIISQSETKNPRINQLSARWQQVWLLALERQRKLNDALDRLEEVTATGCSRRGWGTGAGGCSPERSKKHFKWVSPLELSSSCGRLLLPSGKCQKKKIIPKILRLL